MEYGYNSGSRMECYYEGRPLEVNVKLQEGRSACISICSRTPHNRIPFEEAMDSIEGVVCLSYRSMPYRFIPIEALKELSDKLYRHGVLFYFGPEHEKRLVYPICKRPVTKKNIESIIENMENLKIE